MERRGKVRIGGKVVFACLFLFFLCTPAALANYNFDGFPVETRVNGTVNGGVFVDYEPWAGTKTLTGDFEVSSGNNAGYTRCGDWPSCTAEKSDYLVNIANTILVLEREAVEKPDLLATAINAYHYNPGSRVWFDLSNEVDVTVKNNGAAGAGAFNVSLYADGDLIGKKTVSGLEAGNSTVVQFKWTPIGDDCFRDCAFTDTSKDYNLTAIADCDNDIAESDETNNSLTKVEKACYNGYMADEPLENVFHGILHGSLIFTTGDGTYGGLSPYRNTTYEITLPTGATVELARLNVYYTWHYEKDSCPQMEVRITNETGTYVVPLDRRYNDIKCQCPGAAFVYPWGNYVYNLTYYITGNGTYTVSVKKTGGPSFCIAAPGIEVLYRDESKPLIEVWLNEGADVLLGGRRWDGGYLALEECIANATFPGSIDLCKVKNATLAVVAPWGDSFPDDVLYFNDREIGRGMYHGYHEVIDETIGGISMHVGSTNAQVGMNITNVAGYLSANDNAVGQADDGDCMMPSNAFLVITYKEEEKPAVSISTDKTSYTGGEKMHLGLDVKNPLDFALRVRFNIYLEMPAGGAFTLMDKTVMLPPGLYYSNPDLMVFRLPGIPAGSYTWHAILEDPLTGEIICEDTALWEFVLGGTSTADITEALEQTTVVLDFDK